MKLHYFILIVLTLPSCVDRNSTSITNINDTVPNETLRKIIKIDRKHIFTVDYNGYTVDSVAPFTIKRNSISDSIALEIPESGTHSTAVLFYHKNDRTSLKNRNIENIKPIRTAEGNASRLPLLDLTALQDGEYGINCLECGNIEYIEFSITTDKSK